MLKSKKHILLISFILVIIIGLSFINFILVIIIGLSFSYGFLSYRYRLLPYNFIRQLHSILTCKEHDQYLGNVSRLIEIKNENDILEKRNALIKYIWKQEKLPTWKHPSIIKEISDERYLKLQNLKQIIKLVIDMDYNISSMMYHFQSLKPNNKLIIYHEGHEGDFIKGYNVIKKFLNNGYDVIAISMPLMGMNNQPEIELDRFGRIKFTSHDQFKLLDNQNFSSIKLFIEPVIVAVNYAQKSNYEEVCMTGISGGGWTTVLSAAIDPRISKSYPVAGSYPIYLCSEKYGEKFADYEQTEPGLYRIANYLELYILGSYGDNRKQVQILNIYDSCCFSGHKYLSYKDILYQKMKVLKGKFTILTDDTHHEHKISKMVLNFIIDDLKQSFGSVKYFV